MHQGLGPPADSFLGGHVIRCHLTAEPNLGEFPEGPVEEVVARAVAVQQAKFGLLVSTVAALTARTLPCSGGLCRK